MSRGKGPVPETRSRGRGASAKPAAAGMARAELAARIRDEIGDLKKELRAMDVAGVR